MAEGSHKEFQLKILTPDKETFNGTVSYVKAPGVGGYFGILVNHAAMLSALDVGELELEAENQRKLYAISGGFLEVLNNQVSVLAETAEVSTEIDTTRAEAARKRAEERMKSSEFDVDLDRAQLALYRSLNRLKISKKI
jgi:F-type H+-transporting ATPase subunit epsilon